MNVIDQAKDMLDIDDSDDKKKRQTEDKRATGESTMRERMELQEINQKQKDEKNL